MREQQNDEQNRHYEPQQSLGAVGGESDVWGVL
jgi:hypothetical protein